MHVSWKRFVVVVGLGAMLTAAGPMPSDEDRKLRAEEASRVMRLRLALEKATEEECRGPVMSNTMITYTLPQMCNLLRTSVIPQLRNAQEQDCTQGHLPRPWPTEGLPVCP